VRNALAPSMSPEPRGRSSVRSGSSTWRAAPGGTSDPNPSRPRLLESIAAGAGRALEAGLPILELQNRLAAFLAFRGAAGWSSGGAGRADGLRKDLGRTLGIPGATRLWTAEGLGYHHAEAASKSGSEEKLLRRAEPLPGELLLPVHSGIGLSVATQLLAEIARGRKDATATLLETFLSRASRLALPGWEGTVIEALGLAARLLHPSLVPSIGSGLRTVDRTSSSLFWHGVGRGLYFAPSHALSLRSAGRSAADKALREAPGGSERIEALSGVAWAVTLVNFGSPQVLESLLTASLPSLEGTDAIEHGVVAALLVWARGVGRDRCFQELLHHRPKRSEAAEAWERRVSKPAAVVFSDLAGDPLSGAWGGLFHQRFVSELPRFLRKASGEGAS
jgi:hypothetical protein